MVLCKSSYVYHSICRLRETEFSDFWPETPLLSGTLLRPGLISNLLCSSFFLLWCVFFFCAISRFVSRLLFIACSLVWFNNRWWMLTIPQPTSIQRLKQQTRSLIQQIYKENWSNLALCWTASHAFNYFNVTQRDWKIRGMGLFCKPKYFD